MFARFFHAILATTLFITPGVALAQGNQSEGYKFLEAVKGAKNDDVIAALNKPGTTVINTRSVSNGDTALHIVVDRDDAAYLAFLLDKGANPNVRNNAGITPLVLAAGKNSNAMVEKFIAAKANVNYANASGETALIRAVQNRNVDMVEALLKAGANPDQVDLSPGKSARQYAIEDTRYPAMAKVLGDAPQKKSASKVYGPSF